MNVASVVVMVLGAAAFVAGWRLVARGRFTIWPVMSTVAGVTGLASILSGWVSLSQTVVWPVASAAGAVSGIGLYLATAAFVLLVRRWPRFDRHVAAIYDQRKGLALGPALALASAVNAPGEELFWRGLFQSRLARTVGWPGAAAVTWGAYVLVNVASWNLPIIAGAIVGGAVWGGLALWTHGVLASLVCHSFWTGLMLAFPPGGGEASVMRERRQAEAS
jgi:membrane protease YdiL (CAAX protease family)